MSIRHCLGLTLFTTTLLMAAAGRSAGTADDYDRAFSLRETFANLLTHDRLEPRWASPSRFWFEVNLGDDKTERRLVDCLSGEVAVTDDQELASDKTAEKPIALNRREPIPEALKPKQKSPDGRWRLERRLGALWLCDEESDDDHLLAPAPDRDGSLSTLAHWSPDSRHAVVWETIPGDGRVVHLIESSPEGRLQPKLHEQQYAKPGDHVEWKRPRLFHTESAKEIPTDLAEYGKPGSIGKLRWKADGSAFTVMFNQRGHQSLRLLEIDLSGHVRTLIDEASSTFVHYSGRGKCWLYRFEDGESALWTSERDGWNHLYRIDMATGEAQQLTRGPWVVR
ncbi:MAG: DPP IV N-terminal domain-containing protein, partial [Planctomycetota bacterium]